MSAFMPAPGGAFWSSPRASTVIDRRTVPKNSLKKAVADVIQGFRWFVTKLFMTLAVADVEEDVDRYSLMDW